MSNVSVTTSHSPQHVHWAIVLKAREGKEAQLEAALERFVQKSLGFSGVTGVHLIRPAPETGSREFLLHRSFLSQEHSRLFYESGMYQQYQAETDHLIDGQAEIRPLHGFEAFFRGGRKVPPRWKMAIVTWLGVFPAVLFWSWLLSSRLYMIHPVAITAVVTILVVASLTWVIMPRLVKILQPWLSRTTEVIHLRVPRH
jgi:antibiotic biosynthesis monooxygenase (ABM) superfamily enzyme